MRQPGFLVVLAVGVFATIADGWTQKSADPPNVEATFRIALASAEEYEFHLGKDKKGKPLELAREPKLKFSNPANSDVQGCIFVWTREERPLVVGSFHKWFSRRAATHHWQHEFHSLAEGPLRATFHGDAVWATEEAGLEFVAIPKAPATAANKSQRLLQLRQLGKEFSAIARYENAPSDIELRLLPRPIYSYAAPKQGIVEGGLFAFVRGTDPEMFLLIEARGKDAASAGWKFAGVRMTNAADLRLRHQEKQVWEAQRRPWNDVTRFHKLPHTAFSFVKLPDFLKDPSAKPKP